MSHSFKKNTLRHFLLKEAFFSPLWTKENCYKCSFSFIMGLKVKLLTFKWEMSREAAPTLATAVAYKRHRMAEKTVLLSCFP